MARVKNPYKKYIEAVMKHHADYKLIIERNNDDYYICDGISLLKITHGLYNEFFTATNDAFIKLNNGEGVEYPSGGFDGKKCCWHNFWALYTNTPIEKCVQVTGAVIDNVFSLTHKVKRKIRIAIIGNEIAGFNDEYILAAKEFAGVFMGTKSTAPIKWENHVMGMLIMPIRSNAFHQDIERIQKARCV